MTSKLNDYLFMATFLVLSHVWDYEHQDKWPEEQCKKSVAQSPIDLRPKDMVPIKKPPILCQNWNKIYELTMTNNGHTIVLTLPTNQHITFSEGGLPGTYELVQFHFHWGSEHTLNGERKALEAHFVGFNHKFKNIVEALDYTNGIAVLGVLYEFADWGDNHILQTIIEKVKKLKQVEKEVIVKLNPLNFLPQNMSSFYRYLGSLTTPNCNDGVVWTIFSELFKVSQAQVNEFRSISKREGGKMAQNFRKIQPLNGRTVFKIGVD